MYKRVIIFMISILLLCGCAKNTSNAQSNENLSKGEESIEATSSNFEESFIQTDSTIFLSNIYDFLQKCGLDEQEFVHSLTTGNAVIRIIDFDQDDKEELYIAFYDPKTSVLYQNVYGSTYFNDIIFEDKQTARPAGPILLKIIQTESGYIFLRSGSKYYTLIDGAFQSIDEQSPVICQLVYYDYLNGLISEDECMTSVIVYNYIIEHKKDDPLPLTKYQDNMGTDLEEDPKPEGPFVWAIAYRDIVRGKLSDPNIQEGRTKNSDATKVTGLSAVRLMDFTKDGIPELYLGYSTYGGRITQQIYGCDGVLLWENSCEEYEVPNETLRFEISTIDDGTVYIHTFDDSYVYYDQEGFISIESIPGNSTVILDLNLENGLYENDDLLKTQLITYYLMKQAEDPLGEFLIPEPQSREEAYLIAIEMLTTIHGSGTEELIIQKDYSSNTHYYGLVSVVLADFDGDGDNELFCGYLSKENAYANAAYQRVFGYEEGRLTTYYTQESCSSGGVNPISIIVQDTSGSAFIYWHNEGGEPSDYLYIDAERVFRAKTLWVNDSNRMLKISCVYYFNADKSMDPLNQTKKTITSLK